MTIFSRNVLLSFLVGIVTGALATWIAVEGTGRRAVQNIVAMRWGEGKRYGNQLLYGAEVYLQPASDRTDQPRYSVLGRVWIGRGDGYWHDLGQLGSVSDPAEASDKWGEIQWDDAGLTIGPGNPKPTVISWEKLESHR